MDFAALHHYIVFPRSHKFFFPPGHPALRRLRHLGGGPVASCKGCLPVVIIDPLVLPCPWSAGPNPRRSAPARPALSAHHVFPFSAHNFGFMQRKAFPGFPVEWPFAHSDSPLRFEFFDYPRGCEHIHDSPLTHVFADVPCSCFAPVVLHSRPAAEEAFPHIHDFEPFEVCS